MSEQIQNGGGVVEAPVVNRFEPYRLDNERERMLDARGCADRILEIRRELSPWRKDVNSEQREALHREYQEKIKRLGVDVGRAMGVLPEHLSDETLAKEANLFYDGRISPDYNIVLNVYGDVYLTLGVDFASSDGLKDRVCLSVAMCKQGQESALRVNTTVGITEDGVAVFEANRDGQGGTVDSIMTISHGREIVSVSHVPESGVFVGGGHVYDEPSKTTEVVPADFKIENWLGIYPVPEDGYRYVPNPFGGNVNGKFIDFGKVVSFMSERGFDGEREIPDDIDGHAKLVESFLR